MSEQPVKKGRGCFFYGCLTLVLLVLVAALGLYFGTRYVVNQMVAKYTEASPMALPKVDASPTEISALQERVKAFKTAIAEGKQAEPLALTEREVNALIAGDADFSGLKDKIYVSLEGNQVKGQVSIPLDKFPIGKVKGRYLNGSAVFNVSMDNGVLIVTMQSLEVKGNPVPEQVMAGLRQQNMAQEAYKDARQAEVLRKLESVAIRDGRLEIKARNP